MNPLEEKEILIQDYRIHQLEEKLSSLEKKHDELIRALKIEFYEGSNDTKRKT